MNPTPGFQLQAWYRDYGEAVHRRAWRILRNDAGAEDIMQDTFMRADKYAHTYRGGSALSWLFTITDRLCFDAMKKQKRERFLGDDELQVLIDPTPGWSENHYLRDDLITRLLAMADDNTRAILVHRFFDSLNNEEICERLGISERTLRRSLNKFFKRIEKRGVHHEF